LTTQTCPSSIETLYITPIVVGNLLSSLMTSYDDDISDDGMSDDQRVAEPSFVDLD